MVNRSTDLDSFSEGAYLFYQLNTFHFNVPSDVVDFFAYTPATIVRHIRSYELECMLENHDEEATLDLDVLTSASGRYLLHDNVKVKIDIDLPHCSFYGFRPFTQACKEKTVEALGRFLALPKLSAAVVIMPRGFEEEVRKMVGTSGPHISFACCKKPRYFRSPRESPNLLPHVYRRDLLHCTSSLPQAHQ